MKYVYLAGPITGHSVSNVKEWRDGFSEKLLPGIKAISPVRGEPIPDGVYTPTDGSIFRHSNSIAAKNQYDTHNCDLVLAYLPKAFNSVKVSYGTIFELGWATCIQTPTILVTDDPDLIDHPLVDAKIGWIVPTLDEAAEVINNLFGDYVDQPKKNTFWARRLSS